MKTILCYGDSNLWGAIPGSYNEVTCLAERLPKSKRWTGILQNILGDAYNIVEEGINGRTTSLDELIPGRPYRNGLLDLPFCLESHYPIDLVIIWLGTNDTKEQYNRSVENIVQGLRQLVDCVKKSNKGPSGAEPRILIISPQPIIESSNLYDQYNKKSINKSEGLAKAYQQMAKKQGCDFLDAGLIVKSSKIDGVHLDENQCKIIGSAIAEKVKHIL